MDINSFALGYSAGKKKGGGTPEGFHMVRFFNDDRTTLLYTVFVPTGANAMYAGETPISTEGGVVFRGFEPSATNVTADMDCYAVYDNITTLDETSWADISQLSESGTAQNYWAVGDTKMIRISGMVGTIEVNGNYGVYIIGFDHNEEVEGKGIHFGTFKSSVSNGNDLCLIDSKYDSRVMDGTKCFNVNHWGDKKYGYNHGGWAGCDMRYDILGSTDIAPSEYGSIVTTNRVGYDPSATCATRPVADTLMAALPADLRAVMKPMTKYTNNKGDVDDTADKVTVTVDYLPLLAEFEIFGVRTYANTAEQDYQTRYAYYAAGNSRVKHKHSSRITAAKWWERSAIYVNNVSFCFVDANGSGSAAYTDTSQGLAPIFKV